MHIDNLDKWRHEHNFFGYVSRTKKHFDGDDSDGRCHSHREYGRNCVWIDGVTG